LELARTVLIVEDEPDLRDALAETLHRRGYSVTTAADAAAANDRLVDGLPSLLVTDMMLPGASGFEVIRSVKDRPNGDRVRVIMMSANRSAAHRDYAFATGADRFFTKPFALTAIVQAADELCQLARFSPAAAGR
jgi:DNA-binding response OmpR family regulator